MTGAWVWLSVAIACETGATVCLRMAALGRKAWWLGVVVGYAASFVLLVVVLRAGLGIGAVYGIWASAGVALTAIVARLLFHDPLTGRMGTGIALIAVGVLLIESAAHGA